MKALLVQYISPLSAPPLDLFILQWPGKMLYVQAEDWFNAGVMPPLFALTRPLPGRHMNLGHRLVQWIDVRLC